MCAGTPFLVFEVSEARYDVVLKALTGDPNANPSKPGLFERLTTEQAMEVAFEVGLADGITFDPEGEKPPEINLTDLQLVSYVAALMAVAETNGRQVLTEAKV